ncbi:MAG TPA: hypothetical protein VFR78_06410 [Pyrinomonadaceae bacterium]|nr:hypothetical protein [Pyrinomonadaceae bacterium]
MKVLVTSLLLIACGVSGTMVVESPSTSSQSMSCEYWWSKADENAAPPREAKRPDLSDSRVVMEGIECLLKMKGNKHPAKFRGAISLEVSQIFTNTTADVAALYYISYLFHEKWDHADAVALRGPDGDFNTPEIIAEAYSSYEKWFEEVKEIGLPKAREMKVDPLKHSQIRWY